MIQKPVAVKLATPFVWLVTAPPALLVFMELFL